MQTSILLLANHRKQQTVSQSWNKSTIKNLNLVVICMASGCLSFLFNKPPWPVLTIQLFSHRKHDHHSLISLYHSLWSSYCLWTDRLLSQPQVSRNRADEVKWKCMFVSRQADVSQLILCWVDGNPLERTSYRIYINYIDRTIVYHFVDKSVSHYRTPKICTCFPEQECYSNF